MMFGFANRKRKRLLLRAIPIAILGMAALLAAGDQARARGRGGERAIEQIVSRNPGEPILAIVSLAAQRITVYDADGWILRAPVSSGQRGRETPAGIFSVIQKDAEHYSNIYDDAYMPNMQRITWSGIALHGGIVPGYPASHGCIRMPYDFAARLFDVTQLGLRVIVAPSEASPVDIAHRLLFQPKPGTGELVAMRIAEADEATKKADQARIAAGRAFRDAAQAMVPVRTAENLKLRAEAQLAAAETALSSAESDEAKQQAEDAKTKAEARIAELQAQRAAANAELQPKLDARTAAREAAVVAQAAQAAAAEAARQAAHELEPVSVLISRKTQRLYVRQAFEPIFDGPVTIEDPDRPIGTYVFTAMARTDGDANLRWSVVSLVSAHQENPLERHGRMSEARGGVDQMMKAEPDNAKAALDRIVIPQDVLERIPGATPRSSLIVTDEAPSSETSKGTDFVVVLSDQPQGGIKFRRRSPAREFSFVPQGGRPLFWGSPVARPFSTW